MYDVDAVRRDFPILAREVHGRPLVYLDNGASAQKPQAVIDAVSEVYASNTPTSTAACTTSPTSPPSATRRRAASCSASSARARGRDRLHLRLDHGDQHGQLRLGGAALEPGDEIVLSVMEHHANIVPWHFLRERQGVVLKWVDIEPDGSLDPVKVLEAVGPRTRLIAVTHMSNVLGTVVDVQAICAAPRAMGVPVLVDGSQAAVHLPVDVADLGCDFYAITGHKLYGPTGSGALYATRERLAEMRPFLGGGDMIREVRKDAISYADPPLRMEAGTPGDRADRSGSGWRSTI